MACTVNRLMRDEGLLVVLRCRKYPTTFLAIQIFAGSATR